MATKKINFNEIKKQQQNENKTNSLIEALKLNETEHSVKPNKTTFEKIAPQEIALDPKNEFQNLYPLNLDTINELKERMMSKGYDESQVIHIAKFNDEEETGEICIDGHHRRQAAIEAEIEKVPVYRHVFETRKEAMIYALELQLVRRNLDKNSLYKDFLKLKKLKEVYSEIEIETEDENKVKGKQAEQDAKKLGTSTRQVEKMNAIEASDREDLKEALANNEMTVGGAYDELKGISRKQKKSKENEDDEISESLEDNTDEPKGLTISDHSDHKERPVIEPTESLEENESDKLITARHEGYTEGIKEGLQIAEKVFIFAIAEMNKGKSAKEVYFDERINFDINTMKNFVVPEDDEKFLES